MKRNPILLAVLIMALATITMSSSCHKDVPTKICWDGKYIPISQDCPPEPPAPVFNSVAVVPTLTGADFTFSVSNYTSIVMSVNSGSDVSLSGTTYQLTGLTPSTNYTAVFTAKNVVSGITKVTTYTLVFSTLAKASTSLLQPVITVSSFRALQLNACSNQDFTVAFSTSTDARTLQSATFTLSGDGVGAYRSLRYRPAGDFTTAWKQVDFSGKSVTVPFSVLIPAGLTAKYDLKVCTKSSVSGISNGANTTMAVSSITTDEVGVGAPVGGAFQAAVALPALDLATTATFITSTVNAGRDVSQLILSANQTRSQYILGQIANIKASGPSNMTFAGITIKNIYGNSNLSVTGNWIVFVNNQNNSNFLPNVQSNGDYYNISFSGGLFTTDGSNTRCSIDADIKAGLSGFTSESTGFGFSLRSKWDVVFQNSNGNEVNLTDNTVQDNGVTLTN
jgi:hypothetical protein